MSALLASAIDELKNLPEARQDAIAELIIAELADERSWDAAFARTQPQLAKMAAKVCEDIRAGRSLADIK